jgi:hypothetical protein
MHDLRPFRIFVFLICIAFVLPLIAAVADAQTAGSLTRGSRFTITVTGQPRTPYYVWLSGTFSMSGEPGDQPPIIADSSNVVKDPPGGPYIIGSHTISGGGTIIDNVAPSTGDSSSTNYYALVTTDADGQAIVEFLTSSNTAVRRYAIKVEDQGGNPGQLQVQANLYSRTTPPTAVITTGSTLVPTTVLPTPTSAPTTEMPTNIIPTSSAILPAEPSASPTRPAPVSPGIALGAIAGALLILRKR